MVKMAIMKTKQGGMELNHNKVYLIIFLSQTIEPLQHPFH